MKKLKYITKSIVISFVLFLLSSCDSSIQNVVVKQENLPMWPQFGYSARRTGNPYGQSQNIEPVNGTSTNWLDTIPQGMLVVNPVIDSKGNIYYLHVLTDWVSAILYKVNSAGKILWQLRDSSIVPSFGNGLGLSADEKSIYIPCFTGLFCIDSGGAVKWKYLDGSIYSNVTMPAIGKEGTIYSVIGAYYLQAINPDGTLKWKVPNATGAPSLDKDENIYVGWSDGQVGSNNRGIAMYDKNGTFKWKYNLVKPPFGISIDANNNIYISTYGDFGTGLFSFSKNGNLRWEISFKLGDTLIFNDYATPIITKDNHLWVSGNWYGSQIGRGLIKLDTMGNILKKFTIAAISSRVPVSEIFLDSYENIYFRSEDNNLNSQAQYGSIDNNGNLRFVQNDFVYLFTLSTNGSIFMAKETPDYVKVLFGIK